jgi:tetratricopeptide (TPR) repeat protein
MRERFWKFVLISNLGLSMAVLFWLDNQVRPETTREEPLYITSGKAIKFASLGFDGLVSDIYWMRTILYFGKKLEEQSRYKNRAIDLTQMRGLEPLLEITTDLDPHNLAAYRFGAFFLPDINPEKAIQLVEKGIENNPDQWQLLQDLGFVYWRQGRFREASEIYLKGSKIEGAPQWMLAMAVTMLAKEGDDNTLRDMFRRLCEGNEDKFIKLICTENENLYVKTKIPIKEQKLPNQVGRNPKPVDQVGRNPKPVLGSQETDDGSQKEAAIKPKDSGSKQRPATRQRVVGSRD